ncbi:amidohydrolase family protein [Cnuibacter physcomitrellae]|uniref:amidohydrolase n=1 Tax=Cnuibacter physcomitrellae TaxID=1619308 RepID=UPI002175EE54|nr:amidohydrolase family protein [Cnuibacter physcomitrellae]MCS5498274.1 amidohydrolase family protein [Cnuibacter physcomitrellae]
MTTLYRDGNVITMDPAVGVVDAFLVRDGRFLAVGAEAHERAGDAEVVELEGRTVVPGLIDAHTHLETSAIAERHWVDVRDLPLEQTLQRIAEHAERLPAGEWLIAQGTLGGHQAQNLPRREILDEIVPDRPVIFRPSMHACSANTIALERAGLFARSFSVPGAVIEREDGGVPTGRLWEAFHLFPIDRSDPAELADVLESHIRDHFSRYGVTTIYEVPMSREGMRAFQLLDDSHRLRARIGLNPAVKPGLQPLIDDVEQWAAFGIASGFGNDRLWLGAAKFFLDGAGSAAFDVHRDPDHPARWGAPTRLYDDLVRSLVVGYESGIQFWIHAIGEGAQSFTIDAVREAQRLHGGDGGTRTRIEHVGTDFPVTPDMIERMREADITPVPTAAFMHFLPPGASLPYRTLIAEGFRPPGNSDTAGSQPFATNPWFGVEKMLTRTNRFGQEVSADERVDLHQALRTYTEFAAYAGHREHDLGAIRVGALADFAVLTADPYRTPADELASIRSVRTVVGGDVVWEA